MTVSRQPSPQSRSESRQRGQGNPLGLILVFGIMIAGVSAIVVFGAAAMDDTTSSLTDQRAEKVMTQLDSKAALVALGNTERQRVALPRSGSESIFVREDAGWLNVSINRTGAPQEVVNQTLGEVVYEGDNGRTIAYQGGGVWRAGRSGESRMISPPEFHYRGATLTLPIVTVEGDPVLSDQATIENRSVASKYPVYSDEDYSNPLQSGQVNVTVHSTHYRAWGHYFAERTEGDVIYDDENEIVTAELIVPFNEDFSNAVATTQANGITVNGNDPDPEPSEEGIPYPLVDEDIEDQIADCASGSCTESWMSSINTPGTYYSSGDNNGGWSVSNPGGNVTIVVNGQFEARDIEVQGLADENSVTVMVRDGVTVKDDVNEVDGDPGDFRVLVHSDADVEFKGQAELYGLVYAPGSECNFRGGGGNSPNIQGGVVCETVTINGNPNDVNYDPAVEDVNLGLNPEDQTYITYLHVTVNNVTLRSG